MTTATADKVQLIYTPPTGNRRVGRVHRDTCKHIPKTSTPIPAERIDADALHDATRATCCSPRMFDVRNAIAAGEPTTKEGSTMTAKTTTAKTTTAKPKVTGKDILDAQEKVAADKADAKKTAKPKPAAAKGKPAAKPKPAAGSTRAKIGTFTPSGKDGKTRKCEGACGEVLPVKKFPTVTGTPNRSVECRSDRDARTKAEKAARAAAK